MRALKLFALVLGAAAAVVPVALTSGPVDAPPAFDSAMNLVTNGYVSQQDFDADRAVFEEVETKEEGLGPVYNAESCAACHGNPATGAISQVTELRAGNFNGFTFVDHPGGSLINDRSIHPNFQERIFPNNNVTTFRTSLNTLGDGFVECIDSNTLLAIKNSQPFSQRGTLITVPVLEANGALRAGRFGWKNQHASLISFSADAYLNEMGITSPLAPTDNNSNGRAVVNGVNVDDGVADPEDDGEDIEIFARFMRATGVIPVDPVAAGTADAKAGSLLFDQIGCNTCHVRNITTAPAGTVINGGAFVVPAALGDKVIHPFSDFLLHDIDTGDGIVQNGGQSTRKKLRTAPLWGVRSRTRLMHDGESLSLNLAILRHANQASQARNNYQSLSSSKKNQVIAFLESL
jgi:CxxC motif-containing protein (DUF1111 family)